MTSLLPLHMTGVFFRQKFSVLLFSFALLSAGNVWSTHIVGGEISYLHLTGNNYQITLTVYRDCFNGVAPFDDPAHLGVFTDDFTYLKDLQSTIIEQGPVPNAINSPCLAAPEFICYEYAKYVYHTLLPPRSGGYILAYQRCCRNNSVINIRNVAATGATFVATLPDSATALFNSNPVFNKLPPTFLCLYAPFTFDYSAVDPDGDSLVYSVCTPFQGASQTEPVPTAANFSPLTHVVWASGYSMHYPFGSSPLVINPTSGLMQVTPTELGQFIYGICVSEYRNGHLIGVTGRDFQVNVISCPAITVASIFSPIISCGTLDAEFQNTSFNAATYQWDFGDNTTIADTSSLKNPVYAYPDTGNYLATLIAISGIDPLCNDTTVGVVHVYPAFFSKFGITNSHCSPVFSFQDQSFGTGGVPNYWRWNFGDLTGAHTANPAHQYHTPGTYTVSLIASADSGCVDTMRKEITMLQVPTASFNVTEDTCQMQISLENNSRFFDTLSWNFGDFFHAGDLSPVHHYTNAGTYDVTLITRTDSGCSDTSTIAVSLPPLPRANFSYSVPQCDSVATFMDGSLNATGWRWDFGDASTSIDQSPVHVYELSGHLPVALIAESASGCVDTSRQNIFFISRKKASFDFFMDTCSGILQIRNGARHAYSYLWNFDDGDTSTQINPVHRFVADGEHKIILTVNPETMCNDSTSRLAEYKTPLGEILYAPNSFTPNGDGVNDHFRISIYRPCNVCSMTVFNRWGQLVYQTEDAYETDWDGTCQGDPAPEGVYVYLLKGDGQVRRGAIYLVR